MMPGMGRRVKLSIEMPAISRRRFLASSALSASAVSVAAPSLCGDPLGLPIGCQTYPVRDELGKDFDGTLKELAAIG